MNVGYYIGVSVDLTSESFFYLNFLGVLPTVSRLFSLGSFLIVGLHCIYVV